MVSVGVKHHVYLLRSAKPEETVSHRQNNNVKAEGTLPVIDFSLFNVHGGEKAY